MALKICGISYLLGVGKLTLDRLLHLLLYLLKLLLLLEIDIWMCRNLKLLCLEVLLLHGRLIASIENMTIVSYIGRHASCCIRMSSIGMLGHHLHLAHRDLILVLPPFFNFLFRLFLVLGLYVLKWSIKERYTAAKALYYPENKLCDG